MKHRWKILIVVAIALAFVVLVAVVRHYQLREVTEAYIAQLKAEGELMDLAQILPPPVPPEQNSADTLRHADALLKTNEDWWSTNEIGGMRMIAPGKAMVSWQQPDVRNEDVTNSWKTIGNALAQEGQFLDLSRRIIDKPDFDFGVRYDVGVADLPFENFYLPGSKRAAERLAAAALYDLHQGNTASAVENVRTMLALVKAMRHERLMISELVRITIAQITIRSNWEILQSSNLTDEQLAQLQHGWTDLDFINSDEKAMLMERASGLITLQKWRHSSSGLQDMLDKTRDAQVTLGYASSEETLWHKAKTRADIFMWRCWWSYPDELRSQEGYKTLLDAIRMAETNNSFQSAMDYQNKKLNELKLTNTDTFFFLSGEPDLHSWLSQDIGTLRVILRREMTIEAARQIMITAIALKRYQLKHGTYPANLDSLVPEFVSAVPMDPVDGKSLRYHLNTNGTFLLYSIGKNNKDDRGNPALEADATDTSLDWLNRYALDWVWPQPATPAEIQHFYAHPPK